MVIKSQEVASPLERTWVRELLSFLMIPHGSEHLMHVFGRRQLIGVVVNMAHHRYINIQSNLYVSLSFLLVSKGEIQVLLSPRSLHSSQHLHGQMAEFDSASFFCICDLFLQLDECIILSLYYLCLYQTRRKDEKLSECQGYQLFLLYNCMCSCLCNLPVDTLAVENFWQFFRPQGNECFELWDPLLRIV